MLYGLLGHRIGYSQSPKIHNHAISELGREDSYHLYDLLERDLDDFLERFSQQGGRGLNVTQPYKNLVAQKVGSDKSSVNTLVWKDDKWSATTTDGVGLERAFQRCLKDPKLYSKVVILGAGAVFPVLQDIFAHAAISVLSRKPISYAGVCRHDLTVPAFQKVLTDASLVIQATSAPLFGDDLSFLKSALCGYEGDFVDLNYNHLSALYHQADRQGCAVMDGYPMLIEQARASQELWWGESCSYDELYRHVTTV